MSEYDTIINFASAKGSSFLAPGLIDEPVVITKNLPYKPGKGTPYTDPKTGIKYNYFESNDWTDVEPNPSSTKKLPARTFAAYDIDNGLDPSGNPSPWTMLVYSGETPGLQYDDGAIMLQNYSPSKDYPIIIRPF